MPNPSAPDSPTTRRFPFPWLFTWRFARRCLLVFGSLATVIALAWVIENIRGKKAWNQFKKEAETQGEKLDWAVYVPAPVPDDENFAMTPFLAALFDFNPEPRKPGQSLYRDTNALHLDFTLFGNASVQGGGHYAKSEFSNFKSYLLAMADRKNPQPQPESPAEHKEDAAVILEKLKKFGPVLDELEKASHRPYARFNVHYDEDNAQMILLPHLALMKRAAAIFSLRASAELALGQSEPAFKDNQMVFYLGDTIKNEPFLISGLVRIAIIQLALQPFWEGLATHQWSDTQLAEWEKRFEKMDLLADYETQMRGERALGLHSMDYWKRGRVVTMEASGARYHSVIIPNGWLDQNKVTIGRMSQEGVPPCVDVAAHRVSPSENRRRVEATTRAINARFFPYRVFASGLFPAFTGVPRKYAALQTVLDQAQIACALERYHKAHNDYPETLDSLMPQFLARVPNDVISGAPLKYRRLDASQFSLYSIGWNEKDDGGKLVLNKDATKSIDGTQGDWVWPPYPEN